MSLIRIIPILLLKDAGLVKTQKFKDPKYVGDPLNAVKIFNEKEVDELIFLDITATRDNKKPSLEFLSKVAEECFMPLCYGGGIKTIDEIKAILKVGVEKVAINSYAAENPEFIKQATEQFGSSTIVVSIDVKKSFFGKYEVYTKAGKNNTKLDPVKFAVEMDKMGAGELLVNSIDKDGTMEGYDLELIQRIAKEVSMPVIASGGAGKISHFKEAVDSGASAASAGSMFVFHGKHRAVLISYPSQQEIKNLFCL